MKQKHKFRTLFATFFLVAIATMKIGILYAQDDKQDKQASIKNIIENKRFVFKAQTVLPQRGSTRTLTSDYDLKVVGDSIVSYLPYFGRAYTAPIGGSEGGLQFTSTKFSYDLKEKKNEWDITILPKDAGDVKQLYFSVFNNGSAMLRVISNNREAISFNGRIEEVK
jgi:hypothetical protein